VLKIKICGITNLSDAIVCVESGADMLGFVLYPKSKRYISHKNAAEIIFNLGTNQRQKLKTVAVMVNPTERELEEAIKTGAFDMIQLHGEETPEFCASVSLPVIKAFRVKTTTEHSSSSVASAALPVIKSFKVKISKRNELLNHDSVQHPGAFGDFTPDRLGLKEGFEESVRKSLKEGFGEGIGDSFEKGSERGSKMQNFFESGDLTPSGIERYKNIIPLFDTYSSAIPGGTGAVFDHAKIPVQYRESCLLSGGISKENVIKAVKTINPMGVDLSSSVEQSPGKKDYKKINEFFELLKKKRLIS
jgi:Phosphoribosylanthranilate isomerase